VGLFLGTHGVGAIRGLIPQAGFLGDSAAGFDDADVAFDFVFEALRDSGTSLRFFTSTWCEFVAPRRRTLTLASQRSEPSSILTSLTPV